MRAILIGAGLALGLAACEPAEETEPAVDPVPMGPVDDAIAAEDLPPDEAIPPEEEVPAEAMPVNPEEPVSPPMPADPGNPVG